MTLTPGQTIGPYRVIEQVGRGGMATVYKAHQAALARYVALKVLPAFLAEGEGFTERFRSEAVTVAKLRHPNILQVFDYGVDQGVHYIVTEFVDGGTLADQIGAPLPLDYVVRMLSPIASALDYAHARDVVHRDVKPSNVLLAGDGTPVLSDFGLARMMMGSLPRLTQTGAVAGTPEYMAPEQAMGEDAGAAADRYALAVIAYEMLVGSVPFSADTPLATLLAHAHKPLPLPRERNPRLSPELEAVLLKGLAKDPTERYATCRELIGALDAAGSAPVAPAVRATVPGPQTVAPPVAAEAAPTAPSPSAPPVRVAPVRRGPARGLLLGAAAVALIVVGGITATATGLIGGRPAASASPSARTASSFKGPLAYQAALDGVDFRNPAHDGGAEVRQSGTGVECAVSQPRSTANATIGKTTQVPFFAELDLSTQAEPGYVFSWSFRAGDPGAYQLRVETLGNGTASLRVQWTFARPPGGVQPSASPVGERTVTLNGWQTGKPFTFGVAAQADHYVIFMDGQQIFDFRSDRLPAGAASAFGVVCNTGAGTTKVSALRVYQLLSP